MFESTPKWRKILRQRAINANLGPSARGMKVTAGSYQQTELTSQNGQTTHLLRRLQTINHLDSVTASLNIGGDQLTTFTAGEIIMPRVRQADPGPGLA